MIKKFNTYIKEQLTHLELDPYGEEDWDDDKLVLYIAKQRNFSDDYKKYLRNYCKEKNIKLNYD